MMAKTWIGDMIKPMPLSNIELHHLFTYEEGVLFWNIDIGSAHKGSVAGSMDANGYWRVGFRGTSFRRSRVVYYMFHRTQPPCIDHVNGIRHDDRIENLQEATPSQNGQKRGISANNTSGHPGVCWCKSSGKWLARVTVNRKRINLGYFNSVGEATQARKLGERQHYGKYLPVL